MKRHHKTLEFRKAFHFMRAVMPWVSGSIASLGMAIAVLYLTSLNRALAITTTAPTLSPGAVTLLSSTALLGGTTLDDYEPPDNGGPGKSGGSGTRVQ